MGLAAMSRVPLVLAVEWPPSPELGESAGAILADYPRGRMQLSSFRKIACNFLSSILKKKKKKETGRNEHYNKMITH